MSKVAKFLQLSYGERWLFAQALVLLPLNGLALRLGGFGRWLAILTALAPRPWRPNAPAAETSVRQALTSARLVKAAAAHGVYRASCLPQSLVTWWLLRRQGIDSDLRIGVRKEAGRFEAHAWLEHLGQPLNDSADVRQRFTPFDRVSSPLGIKFR